MYVFAAVALLLAAVVISVLVFVPRGVAVGEDGYTPGSIEAFRPIAEAVLLLEPPGLTQTGTNSYRVVIEAFNWEFVPNEIRIPAGAELTIRAHSQQDFHGLAIMGTNVFLSLLRNEIAEATYTFDEPGEYLMWCSDYCGEGHGTMTGRIIVE